MKRLLSLKISSVFLILFFGCISFASCDKYDDSDLWNTVNELQERVQKLEKLCEKANANIHSIQTLVDALNQKTSIASILPLPNNKGYKMTLSDGKVFEIYHGKDGIDGQNGQDGSSSQLSIKDVGNGLYVWMLNGEILKDSKGDPLPVNGKDAPLPQLKSGFQLGQEGVAGSWEKTAVYITVDNGRTWTQISAEKEVPLFSNVDVSRNDCIIFTTSDGTQFTIPRSDELQSMLIGKWYKAYTNGTTAWDETLVLNADYTFTMTERPYYAALETYNGVYEFSPNTQKILFYVYNEQNELNLDFSRDVVKVDTENLLLLNNEMDRFHLYYKTIPDILEQTTVFAPKEGGIFSIGIKTKDEIVIKTPFKPSNPSNPGGSIYDIPPVVESIVFSWKKEDKRIVITVDPAKAQQMLDDRLIIYDEKGFYLATLLIKQEGNHSIVEQPTLSENGIRIVSKLYSHAETCITSLNKLDGLYTGVVSEPHFRIPVSSSDATISSVWGKAYSLLRNLNEISEACESVIEKGPMYNPLRVMRAFIHYRMAVLWGNIFYADRSNPSYYFKQLSTDELYSKLIPELETAIGLLDERKNVNNKMPDAAFLSKDVARFVLAKIYMHQENYSKAIALLKTIESNNYYQLENVTELATPESKEVMWMFNSTVVLNYSDVLLALAECEQHLHGDGTAYLNQVASKKGIILTSDDFNESLKTVYKTTQGSFGEYFAFLKRNKIAMKELNISNMHYLLLPIPEREFALNPNVVQNPGY